MDWPSASADAASTSVRVRGDETDPDDRRGRQRGYRPRSRVSTSNGQTFSQRKCSMGNDSEMPSQKDGWVR